MTIGHHARWRHWLSGFVASQMPAPMMGMEQRRETKFKMAVMLLLRDIIGGEFRW